MDINEVFDEMIGKDEEGCPKSYLSLVHNLYIKKNEEVQTCNEYETTLAELIIERLDSLTQIKLKFDRAAHNDLKIFWNIIQSCIDEIAAAPVDDVNNFRFLTLTIIPKIYNGSQFAVASNPLFVNLVANTPNEEADTISMVFNSDTIVFYENYFEVLICFFIVI